MDFELFRPELAAALDRADRSRGGRTPYDAVRCYACWCGGRSSSQSDDGQAGYQLRDRLSFMRVTTQLCRSLARGIVSYELLLVAIAAGRGKKFLNFDRGALKTSRL